MTFDLNLLRGILTAILLFAFIGMWAWAWSKKREPAFNEAANLPFADETTSQNSGKASTHDTSAKQPTRLATGEHSV